MQRVQNEADDSAMLEKARESIDAGATGLIFGRNASLELVHELHAILDKYPS